jgi:succinate-semialdehyde dehydrogenase/glutarate-semialdehyde dehydrogenase
MTFQAINPTTGDVVSSYDEMPPDMVKGIVDDVNEAFLGWRRTSFTEGSVFGLGGGVITRDLIRGQRIAAELIESGSMFVNDHVRSDPRLPFGGIKESGYGRELSTYGIKEFVNIKTVYVAG